MLATFFSIFKIAISVEIRRIILMLGLLWVRDRSI